MNLRKSIRNSYSIIHPNQVSYMIFYITNTYIKYLDKLHSSYSFLNSYAWRMTELNKNLDDALIKADEALILIDNTIPQYPNILDTKAEVLWKLGNIEEAVKIIQEAIDIDPSSEYYKAQREKFLNS